MKGETPRALRKCIKEVDFDAAVLVLADGTDLQDIQSGQNHFVRG